MSWVAWLRTGRVGGSRRRGTKWVSLGSSFLQLLCHSSVTRAFLALWDGSLLKCHFLQGIFQKLPIRIYVDFSFTLLPFSPYLFDPCLPDSRLSYFNVTFFFCPVHRIASFESVVNIFALFMPIDFMVILEIILLKIKRLPFLGGYRSQIHPFSLL